MQVAVRHPAGRHGGAVLRAAARTMLSALALGGRELSVALVTDAAIRALNARWRGKDRPTDVLSFPQEEPVRARRARGPIGDVVISLDTARRQAREGGWALSAELRRLLAHGLLHCLGHDHEEPEQAGRMARAERRLLGRAGLASAALEGSG